MLEAEAILARLDAIMRELLELRASIENVTRRRRS
jgi:hypothetical protein